MLLRRRSKEDRSKGENEIKDENEDDNKILLRYGRIAVSAAVKWKRIRSDEQLDEGEGQAEQDIEQEVPKYTSRKLLCTRCQATQETRRIQLRTINGFRAIHCRECGRQERVAFNHCTCGVLWHRCELHRIDPKVHESRRGTKAASKKQVEKAVALSSKRKAPYTRQGQKKEDAVIKKTRKRKAEDQIIRHVAFVASTAAPSEQILERLRARVNRKQAEHEVISRIKARGDESDQSQKTEVEVKIKDNDRVANMINEPSLTGMGRSLRREPLF